MQQVGYLKDRQEGVPCNYRVNVFIDKSVDDLCDICAFTNALKKDPEARPPRRVPWELAYEDDATAFVAGYEVMVGKRTAIMTSNEDSDLAM